MKEIVEICGQKLEVVRRSVMTGCQLAVRSGDKLYVWPDFKVPCEVKILTVPTFEEEAERMMRKELRSTFNNDFL